jgi:hypothetical protein
MGGVEEGPVGGGRGGGREKRKKERKKERKTLWIFSRFLNAHEC